MSHLWKEIKQITKEKAESLKEQKQVITNKINKQRGFDRNDDRLPPLVAQTCDWIEKHELQTEGLFRMSGKKDEIMKLKKMFDQGKDVDFTGVDAHTVCGVLKQFLIEPEESILTEELYDAFLNAASRKVMILDLTFIGVPEEGRLECFQAVIYKMPPGNKVILHRLCRLLHEICKEENKAHNKMSSKNLAICFAPTLLRKREQTAEQILRDSETALTLVEYLIINNETVFQVDKSKKYQLISSNEDVKQFMKTLKLGSIRLAKSVLNEMALLEEAQEEQEAQTSGLDRHRSNSDYGVPDLKHFKQPPKHASQVWAEFFSPPEARKEIESTETNQNDHTDSPPAKKLPVPPRNRSYSDSVAQPNPIPINNSNLAKSSDAHLAELSQRIAIDEEDSVLEAVEGYVAQTNKKHFNSIRRQQTFRDAMNILEQAEQSIQNQ